MDQPTKQTPEFEDALRAWILMRAREINGTILGRIATVSDDLDEGRHRAALGGLDGIEREVSELRSFLLLIP